MSIRFAAGVLLALALAGCGGQNKPAAQASETSALAAVSSDVATTGEAPAQTTATAPAKGDKPDWDFVVGKWGTDGDCALAIELRGDGTSDGPFGNWSYRDGVIGFADDPEFKVNVTVIDDKTMESTNPGSDKTSKMTRCP